MDRLLSGWKLDDGDGRGRAQHEPFAPEHALSAHPLSAHQTSRDWLKQKLDETFDGVTVVVTHHAPHPISYIQVSLAIRSILHLPAIWLM